MTDASASAVATNPVCGDLLYLYLKVIDGKISQATFKIQGCPPSVAAGSVLTEMITNLTIGEALALRPQDVARALENLPRNKEHCSVLAIDALRAALVDMR